MSGKALLYGPEDLHLTTQASIRKMVPQLESPEAYRAFDEALSFAETMCFLEGCKEGSLIIRMVRKGLTKEAPQTAPHSDGEDSATP